MSRGTSTERRISSRCTTRGSGRLGAAVISRPGQRKLAAAKRVESDPRPPQPFTEELRPAPGPDPQVALQTEVAPRNDERALMRAQPLGDRLARLVAGVAHEGHRRGRWADG